MSALITGVGPSRPGGEGAGWGFAGPEGFLKEVSLLPWAGTKTPPVT